jgi:UDP-glucuronate decarboxylase
VRWQVIARNPTDAIKPRLLSDDPTQRQPDIALARKLLDWSPTVDLDEGLRRTTAYFRDLLAN